MFIPTNPDYNQGWQGWYIPWDKPHGINHGINWKKGLEKNWYKPQKWDKPKITFYFPVFLEIIIYII